MGKLQVIEGTDKNFDKIIEENELKLIYIYVKTNFFEKYLEILEKELKKIDVTLITVDIDKNSEIQQKLRVNSLPQILIGWKDVLNALSDKRINPQKIQQVIPHFVEDAKKRLKMKAIMKEHTVEITSENYEQITKENDHVIVDFWADWCGPCLMQGKIFEDEGEAFLDAFPNLIIGKLNVDKNNKLAQKYDANAIPMMQLYNKGDLVNTLTGVKHSDHIIEKMNEKK